jgi:hypothetical protein
VHIQYVQILQSFGVIARGQLTGALRVECYTLQRCKVFEKFHKAFEMYVLVLLLG